MTSQQIYPAIAGDTRLYVIIGDPVAHTRAPEVFNPLFLDRGVNAVMVPMQVKAEDLEIAFEGLQAIANLDGIIVTIPHKLAMTKLVDEVLPMGHQVGAINAVRRLADGRWVGDIFDGRGFIAGLMEQGHSIAGRSALLVGAGGAGRAIAFALAEAELAALTLYDIESVKAARLASDIIAVYPDIWAHCDAPNALGHDIVINATPLGMNHNDPYPVAPDTFHPRMLVADIVMKPEVTSLLTAARARGCKTHIGRHMLEGQVEAIADFFELPMPQISL